MFLYYADLDADGYGSGAEQYGCVIPDAGVSGNNLDCNDSIADINPSMIELVGNDIDEDCDGNVGTLILQFSESNKFEISPNPVMNTLTLTLKLIDRGNTYEIYHSNGKQIERGIITDSVTRIDESQWPTGVYIIQFNSQKQKFN
ncbi:MAG: T9SS type A sorting domain-containing protein, partial [Bacteroidota bacterium]